MGFDDEMERSCDGTHVSTQLPDKTEVHSWREKQELEGYNNFSTNTIHMVYRHDFTCVKIKQDGEVVVVTSEERVYLNKLDGRSEPLGKDKTFFFEMFGVPTERRSGVYSASCARGRLWT